MDLNREDFKWAEGGVSGASLLLVGGVIDSRGTSIDADKYYDVGAHKETGHVIIVPIIGRSFNRDFVNSLFKDKNRFN